MKRICTSCQTEIFYKTYKVFWKANKNNSTCRACFYKSLVGRHHSEKTKNKIGKSNMVSLLGNIPYNKGVPMSRKQKIKCKLSHLGKKTSEKTKQKHRANSLMRLKKLGIPPTEDRGAKRFIETFNKDGFNFHPKTFWDLGYIADGYDEKLHMWLEFDPPHHYYVDGSLKDKDVVRQRNIINYFNSMGVPLKDFIRVKADKDGNVIEKPMSVLKG